MATGDERKRKYDEMTWPDKPPLRDLEYQTSENDVSNKSNESTILSTKLLPEILDTNKQGIPVQAQKVTTVNKHAHLKLNIENPPSPWTSAEVCFLSQDRDPLDISSTNICLDEENELNETAELIDFEELKKGDENIK